MSQENVEIVRRALDAFDADLTGMARFWDPEIDWRAIEGAPDDVGLFKGHDAMRRYYRQWFETFDDFRIETEELIDAGEQVVAMVHAMGRMKGSDAQADMRLGVVFTVKDELIVRGREFASRDEALEAVRVSE